MIAVREDLGLCRQTFFLQAGSWDAHFELPQSFAEDIGSVSANIAKFQRNLNAMGLADSVMGFTTSEFSRTLRSTGAGSDHAWGGPQFVFGGPVNGGKILGRFADLTLGGDDDTGRGGRILPSNGCDEYFSELLRWFGLTEDQLDIVLPNYDHFRGRNPIGLIGA